VSINSSANGRSPGDAVPPQLLAEVALPAGSGAPAAARLVIAEYLTGRVSETVLRDAALLATELVTNSVRHGGHGATGPVILRIALSAGTVRLETEDPGIVGSVVARRPDAESEGGGFGLAIVDALAARWGVHRAAGTTVWLELTRA
jgi:anti-sigma regulatory factor (Ser/Thr protein kinase)